MPKPGAVGRRRQVTLELTLAPVAHHVRQRDFHRADGFAPPAEARGVGEIAGLIDTDQHRCQHRAHGAGIDPAVSVTANLLVDRAVVHAGAAADAAQHVLEVGPEHGRAAVVKDDDVIFRPARRDLRGAAARWRMSCRPTCPGRSPSAPARRRIWLTSSSVGTIFSIEASTMCTRGNVSVRSPLPSLVTITDCRSPPRGNWRR